MGTACGFGDAWLVQLTGPVRRVAQAVNNQLLRLVPKSIQPLPALSDEEYRELLELAWQSGTLGISEKKIILSITHLDRRTVGDLHAAAITNGQHSTPKRFGNVGSRAQTSTPPIADVRESPDSIVGILNTPKLLADPKVDMVEVIDFHPLYPKK